MYAGWLYTCQVGGRKEAQTVYEQARIFKPPRPGMDVASRTGRKRRIEIRRIAKSAAARGRSTSLIVHREKTTSTKFGPNKKSIHNHQPVKNMIDSRQISPSRSSLSASLRGSPLYSLDTVNGSQREVGRQYCRSASKVSSVVSGITSMAVSSPPPFSHEVFDSLKRIPSGHGNEGNGGDTRAAYTPTSSTLSSNELPPVRQGEEVGAFNSSCPPHGAVSVCGRRRNMEDFVHIAPEFVSDSKNPGGALHFFGVFDGHGGSQVSRYCSEHLHEILAAECVKAFKDWQETGGIWATAIQQAMATAFLKIDTDIGSCSTTDYAVLPSMAESTGSTAVVVVVDGQHLTVANCGDSRAVLSRHGKTIPLTSDHKPQRPDELKRVETAGGHVFFCEGLRVGGILAMTRAIGDRFLKPFVIADPEVVCVPRLVHDDFIILASDGLWDVVTNANACEVVRRCIQNYQKLRVEYPVAENGYDSPSTFAASLLTKVALAAGSSDNISILVVDLAKH